jgi:hypothetical protein
MKRLHAHVGVEDLAQSIRFYSTLFSAEPTVIKDDYANWMLEDPCVNLEISTGSGRTGVLRLEAEDEMPKAAPAEVCCTRFCCCG